MNQGLRLYEEVMLLALHGDKGTIEAGAWYHQAAGGAILAELVLNDRVRIVRDGRKRHIEPISSKPLGDELLDEWLAKIDDDSKIRTVDHWVNKISATKELKGRIARGLSERGILGIEEDKILFIFSREVYPEINPTPEREIRRRLRDAVMATSSELDSHTSVLLSLAVGTGLIELVLDKKERKAYKQRLDEIVNGEVCGKAARDLVMATHQAIVVACIVPVVTS